MTLVYFIILVSSLVFVHELGHFLFAKLFGVKVITFSLGFGPKLLRWRGRETEYRIGMLPLGGYIRMLEEAKADAILPEERGRTFESLALYKRILIVLAGPLMNMLFPVLLYFTVFIDDGPFLPPTVGIVLPGHAAFGKLSAGDRVMEVNGRQVGTFDELKREVARHPAAPVVVKVFRDNRHLDIELTTEESLDRRGFDTKRVGTLGIQSSAPAPVIGVPNPNGIAYRAGLRSFDVITQVGGKPVRRFIDLESALLQNRGETVPVTYFRPQPLSVDGLMDMAIYDSGVVALTPAVEGQTLLERTGLELADLYVAALPERSPLRRAPIEPGAKLLELDGRPVEAWSVFQEGLLAPLGHDHVLTYSVDGERRTATFPSGLSPDAVALQWLPLAPEQAVEHPAPIRYAMSKAVEETVNVTQFVLSGMYRLVQGRLSLADLSGPLTIYEVAGREGRKGPDFFIWMLALMSINLGLLNLLPVPVLDGGHLMFFGVEALIRRPLPLRVREVAHIVGMMVIFALMVISFKNDIARQPWDDDASSSDWSEHRFESWP